MEVQVFMGESKNGSILFDKAVYKQHLAPQNGHPLYLITPSGLFPLTTQDNTQKLSRTCGEPDTGFGFSKSKESGILMAKGKLKTKSLIWFPATKVKCKKNICLKGKNSNKNIKLSSYFVADLNVFIHQSSAERKKNSIDIRKYCHEMAQWNEQYGNIYEKVFNSCMESRGYCEAETQLLIEMQQGTNTCKKISYSVINCESQATTGHNLHEFLGVLLIKHEKNQEKWFLWNAPGYEGDGIYAIEFNELGKESRTTEEWLVYNGC